MTSLQPAGEEFIVYGYIVKMSRCVYAKLHSEVQDLHFNSSL